jgi:hypothetical protein
VPEHSRSEQFGIRAANARERANESVIVAAPAQRRAKALADQLCDGRPVAFANREFILRCDGPQPLKKLVSVFALCGSDV